MTDTPRGRPRGSLNKVTNLAKQAIQMAFDELGGVKRLVEWVREDKKNEFVFYTKVYPMLLPRPAPEPPPQVPAQIVQGALVWRKPKEWSDPAFPASSEAPLSAARAQETVDAAVAGGLKLPSAEELAERPADARAAEQDGAIREPPTPPCTPTPAATTAEPADGRAAGGPELPAEAAQPSPPEARAAGPP